MIMTDINDLDQIIKQVKNGDDPEKIKMLLSKLQEFIPPNPDNMIELDRLGNRSYFLTNTGVVVRFAPASEEGLPFLYIPTRNISYDEIPLQTLNNIKRNLNRILNDIHYTLSIWIRSIPTSHPMYSRVQSLIMYLNNQSNLL